MKEEEERIKKEEEERIRKLEEEEAERKKKEEEERIRIEKEKQIRKEEAKKAKEEAAKAQHLENLKRYQGMAGVILPPIGGDSSKIQKIGKKQKKPPKKEQKTLEQQKNETQPVVEQKVIQEQNPNQSETKAEVQPSKVEPQPTKTESQVKIEPEKTDDDLDDWEKLADEEKLPTNNSKEEKKNEKEKNSPELIIPKNESNPVTNNNNEEKPSKSEESESLRSPICCILGHVDTGKTKLLDKIRKTNVQEGEAGGITQQIGATFFPMQALQEQTSKINRQNLVVKVPGLLIIDTPGHESFTNLRSRGSSLCDIAILVVDIMHGLEPQTLESLNLLKMRKTPFIVALNKVDRIYGWKERPNAAIQNSLKAQDQSSISEFEQRVQSTVVAFAEQGLNATLYYKNKDFRKYISIVPTSAITGEGIPDMLMLLIQLTQNLMTSRLLYLSKLQCTVLEVKVVEGLGTTIDVILVNGVLREGDKIVLCGLNGPIVTTIRALLTPHPLKELRVKSPYIHHKEVRASQGVKISAADLEKTVAGSSLIVYRPGDDLEELKKEVMADLNEMIAKTTLTDRGVYVQASTLGSLEALLEFLKQSNIPVSGINIGPVNKKDVIRCSVMLEHVKEYAVILAFDVKVTKEAREIADSMGVKIFTADIIYHLFDQFTAYIEQIKAQKKEEAAAEAVFPVRLKILPEYIFNKSKPIVMGVDILEGVLKIGTPIVVPSKNFCELGKVTSIEENHKAIEEARKGKSVAVKLELPETEQQKMYGRHFDDSDELVSKISRKSIDLLKENFKDALEKEDIILLKKLKAVFKID